jgi:methionyl-tRNA formyltransferase
MKIALMGQGPFGAKVLESILEKAEDSVIAVYTPPEAAGGRADPLADLAREKGLPLSQPARMRDAGVAEAYAALQPDLGVMAFVTDIVPLSILECPKLGTIQYHPSLLPRHRGGSAINWAIIQGDTKTGLTIFWTDGGIDTGPILLQKEAEITADDTVGSLYFNKLFPLGVEAMMESIELVRGGKSPRIAQDESQATHEGLCQDAQGLIDWSRDGQTVYNLIRGCNPQPGAWTTLRGEKLKLFDSEPATGSGTPGEIIASDAGGITVATGQGAILVKRLQAKGSPKTPAAEYAEAAKLKTGEKLG